MCHFLEPLWLLALLSPSIFHYKAPFSHSKTVLQKNNFDLKITWVLTSTLVIESLRFDSEMWERYQIFIWLIWLLPTFMKLHTEIVIDVSKSNLEVTFESRQKSYLYAANKIKVAPRSLKLFLGKLGNSYPFYLSSFSKWLNIIWTWCFREPTFWSIVNPI